MISIPLLVTPEMARVQAPLQLLAMLGVSLLLIFAGRTLAKVLAFVVVGLVGAAFGGTLAAQFLSPGRSLVGAILGFVIGGLLGVSLMILGIGLAAGYAGYLLALELALSPTVALVFGFIGFIVGLVLANKVLALGTAIVGEFLLSNTLALIGFGAQYFHRRRSRDNPHRNLGPMGTKEAGDSADRPTGGRSAKRSPLMIPIDEAINRRPR